MSAILPEAPIVEPIASRPRRAIPVCEFGRAHLELLGVVAETSEDHGCSPEAPTSREYPPPGPGGRPFVLCNGHLRDIYGSLDRSRRIRKGNPL